MASNLSTSSSTSHTNPHAARLLRHVLSAESRIRKHIRTTPLEHCPWLSRLAGPASRVLLKCESEQHTGSFKLRGAYAKLTALAAARATSEQKDGSEQSEDTSAIAQAEMAHSRSRNRIEETTQYTTG